jgi:hypothetical protein
MSSSFMVSPFGSGCVRNTMINPTGLASIFYVLEA